MSASLVSRIDQHDMGKRAIPLLYLWTYFNLIGNTILLPILVLTFLISKRIKKRHPTLINVCMTWILSGFFSLLLFYAGKAKPTDPKPSPALCIAQTSFLYGITPMWSVGVFILMYFIVGIVSGDRAVNVGRGKMILMLGAPYIVQFVFTIATLALSLKYPHNVSRGHRFFYCALKLYPLSNAMAIFTFIACLGITMLEVQLALILYRNWRGLRRAGQHTSLDLQLLLRVLAFGVYIFFGMVVNVISMFSEHSLAPDVYAATAGTVVFLVFGSQADVLRAWCFWRWRRDDFPSQLFPVRVTRESGWANLNLVDPSDEKPGDNGRDYSAPLPSPTPVQIADHVHGLHGRDGLPVPPVQQEPAQHGEV